ncbi:tetratricopeptide repeat protein [Leptospira alstonii serovar Pingchang str. 80-412]|uniref:Tetratricopeptide repeat protein n=2 Tax=Leptospira alstonii TaxID=28452 RepID=M6CSQ8_9LEPT|nr:tetratricopeptide repeat protein [Leptospira alstonii serovar Sichuan str. 79601]EQA82250.1 tetratricopeptide repeat protein [Leptospira alstonii serovar Pingchang str. 80-412]
MWGWSDFSGKNRSYKLTTFFLCLKILYHSALSHRWNIFFYFSLLLFIFVNRTTEAQLRIGDQYYSGLLWGKNEILSPSYYNDGSFLRTDQDFILAAGRNWKGDPPPSRGSFIFEGKEILNCGLFNNEAVSLLEKGTSEERQKAISILEEGTRFDPKFFPFRYNLGRAYHLEKKYQKSITQFEYASAEIPEYYRTYIHLGTLYEIIREPINAAILWKKAVSLNEFHTEALLLLADHYIRTDLKNRALLYIKKAASIDEQSPDARMGKARIELLSSKDLYAYRIFKNTELVDDLGQKKQYNKKFHFFYAETASKVGDYVTAADQYEQLLKYPNDPFFSEFSYKVIERRRDLAKRFAEIKSLEEENKNE